MKKTNTETPPVEKLTDFDIFKYLCNTGDAMDIAMCPDFVGSKLTKQGTEITMGAAPVASQKLMNGEWQPVLYLFNKKKFFEIKKAGKLPVTPTP